MNPFEEGHDRLKEGLADPGFKAPNINPNEIMVEGKPTKVSSKEYTDETKKIALENNDDKGKLPEYRSYDLDNSTTVELHDPKNRLISLVKNAEKNKTPLEERNKRIKESKETAKRQYGW